MNSRNTRPLSFIPSPRGEVIDTPPLIARQLSGAKSYGGPRFQNPFQDDNIKKLSPGNRSMTAPVMGSREHDEDDWDHRRNGANHSLTSLMRQDSDSDSPSYQLAEIDVDTSPDAVAREFHNLQALRRMSMDVDIQDPDLPSFGIPAVAPANDADEDDPSRMYWVPARLHPELAPKEFKSFIQEKVKTIKRSSLSTTLSDDQMSLSSGQGSLRRRKSMLSRQIDNGHGYQDGAVRLQRKKSESDHSEPQVGLQELEHILSDPSQVPKRRSVESSTSEQSGGPSMADLPILSSKAPGGALKRSTRTQYRKGSLRKNPLLARRQTLKDDDERSNSPSSLNEDIPRLPQVPDVSELSEFADAAFGLSRAQTEPPAANNQMNNFSRPGRRGPKLEAPSWSPTEEAPAVQKPDLRLARTTSAEERTPYETMRQTPAVPPHFSIPQIIEPIPEPYKTPVTQDGRPMSAPVTSSEQSSHADQTSTSPQAQLSNRPIASRPAMRPSSLPHRPPTNHRAANITLDDIAASSIVNSRQEGIVLTTAAAEEAVKKNDKKSKGKDESKKTSWGWFSGGDKEEKEQGKKNKLKSQKVVDKSHDGARLDVLQGAIDGTQPKPRESTVYDRQSIHLEEDTRKSHKKSSHEQKKEKDGLFSSLFGNKKKGEKDAASLKKRSASSLRGLSPDPPHRSVRPDIDYPWTRFSITEERAIYRMAHIKLANPRRELYSQVLLSNFMYSYLAKVQQMHPHVQIPQSAAQKQAQRQERQQQQRQAEQERKQERQERLREQEQQKQMRQSKRDGRQGEYSQQLQYHEVCISRRRKQIVRLTSLQQHQLDPQYAYRNDIAPNDEEQADYNQQLEYQRHEYGNSQQVVVNGSTYGNGINHQQWQHQSRHQQYYQAGDEQHRRSGNGRDGFW